VDFDELSRFCAERLGASAPRILFRIDAVPRNAMGKILRRRLSELAMQKLRQQGLSA
jgi:acyl-coenzyme A synthetase/AMP-(fatty) acid ligase